MSRRFLLLLPLAGAAVLIPVGVAAAQNSGHGAAGQPAAPATAVQPLRAGAPSGAGWGSTFEPPRAGSGIDTTKVVPGLSATYGAATGGLFASPPTDPGSGYVAQDSTHQPPAVGEIHSFLASDGKSYYRVVNRTPAGVTYSH